MAEGSAPAVKQLQDARTSAPLCLRGRSCQLELDRPRIMGILNVTPDSFSDGGAYQSLDRALMRARQMAYEGADLIDVGGESTRPGAGAVSVQEELDRVLPVLEALAGEIGIPLSIDTNKSEVARAAVAAGAEFVNDISGLMFDPAMAAAVAESGAGLFVMHTRGRPERMQLDTRYADLLGEVLGSLRKSLRIAMSAGVAEDKIAIDPGIGFGKDLDGNLELLRRLAELTGLGRPILLGTSRKSFIGRILGQDDPRQRLAGSLATVALGVAGGASIFRVHDVASSREAALTAWAVCHPAP
jgi:dihydropteroate synthase